MLICVASCTLVAVAQMVSSDLYYSCHSSQQWVSRGWIEDLVTIESCQASTTIFNNTAATWYYSENIGQVTALNRTAPVRSQWTFSYGVIPPFSYIRLNSSVASDRYFVFATVQNILQNALQLLNGSKKLNTANDWKSMKNVVVLQEYFKGKDPLQENIIVINSDKPEAQSLITGAQAVAQKEELLKKLKETSVNQSSTNLPVQ